MARLVRNLRKATADAKREAAWRAALTPYYREYGIDPNKIPAGPGRAPFTAEAAGTGFTTPISLNDEARAPGTNWRRAFAHRGGRATERRDPSA